jgi:hypothetical protein
VWCITPTSSSIAKALAYRFGVLDADSLQNYEREEVASSAGAPDQGQGQGSAQSSKAEKNTRNRIRPRQKVKGNPVAEQSPAGASKTSKENSFDKEAARRRSNTLRKDYPGIKDVPKFVTKSLRKLLIARYGASHTDAQQGGPEVPPGSQPSRSSKRESRGGRKSNPPRKAAQDLAGSTQGNSAENPIDLD